MIIKQSTIRLDASSQNLSSLKINQKTASLSLSSDQTPTANQRWAVESQASYQYNSRVRSQLITNSQVTQPNQLGQPNVIQHSMIEASQKLTAHQLVAKDAQIAIRHAFPSDSTQAGDRLKASGLAEFRFEQHIQYQQTSHNMMTAQGSVTLSDGREISFNLHLEHQQRSQIDAMTSLSLQKVAMQDPLVINLGDQPVSLLDTHFEFDLLGQGEQQTFAQLGGGAGYLTFDANGDGKVTDGTELFGTQTGDAFAELARFDDDGNGWIDENDPIFSQLKIWYDQSDDESTISLAQAGVGAIYLGNVPFDYELRDAKGALQGQSKQAGLVLMENGEVKTSQAIDLVPILSADSIDTIEQHPAFKSLQKMSEVLNAWQQAQEAWRAQLSNTPQPGSKTETTSPQNWFEELHKRIQEMVEERRVLLERMFGKPDKTKLAQA